MAKGIEVMIGIIGYAINSGIGSLIHDFKKHLPIDSHYVITHDKRGVHSTILNGNYVLDSNTSLEDWLDNIKTLIFIELPYFEGLLSLTKERGIRTICVVNCDWFNPSALWVSMVDTFIAPNKYTFHQLLENRIANCVYIPASIDTEYFTFQPHTEVNSFLFNNGWGGYRKRKNLDMVVDIFAELDLPLIINSQIPVELAYSYPQIETNNENYPERISLYQSGDICLIPTKWEGCGLHILEAMACGIPPLVTNGEPMSEYMPIETLRIKADLITKHTVGSFSALEYAPNRDDLWDLVEFLYERNISWLSFYCRELIENQYSWEKNKDKYLQVLENK